MRFSLFPLAAVLFAGCEPFEPVAMGAASEVSATLSAATGYLTKATVEVRVTSSAGAPSTDAHFQWMEQHGVDGVGLQRLVAQTADSVSPLGARSLEVTSRVRDAAEAHGRGFYIVYDLAGAPETDWVELIKRDWSDVMVGQLHVTDSPAYQRDGGRPVVVLRGLGFVGGPGTVAQAMDVIDWFKALGCSVVGGVPSGWRTGEGTRPNFLSAFLRLDVLQPWAAGAFASDADAEAWARDVTDPDQTFAAQHGIAYAYQKVMFPIPDRVVPTQER